MELVPGFCKQLVEGRDVAGTGAADLGLAQDLAQGRMTGWGVRKLAGFPGPTGLVDNQGNGFAADIDSGDLHRLVLQIQSPSV